MTWKSYIQPNVNEKLVRDYWNAYRAAFEPQYNNLKYWYASHGARRIACLGAGVLSEIPIMSFLQGGSEVVLIDRIEGLTEKAFELMQADAGDGRASHAPSFVIRDITAGRAENFVRYLENCMSAQPDARAFLHAALECLKQSAATYEHLPFADDTFDLVTSSMVVSQFYVDPYMFVDKILREGFGDHVLRADAEIRNLATQLRQGLYWAQVEGHIMELHRLVSKNGGRVYFSVEFFRTKRANDQYYLVAPIFQATQLLSQYFRFALYEIPPEGWLSRADLPFGPAVVQAYMLEPRRYRGEGMES